MVTIIPCVVLNVVLNVVIIVAFLWVFTAVSHWLIEYVPFRSSDNYISDPGILSDADYFAFSSYFV